MFARYEYQAGTSVANLLSDITAILTGETNKVNLSASCVQNMSYIVSTVASGWTLHDNSAGTNKKAFSAPCLDSTVKYFTVDCNTAGYVLIGGYESWNQITHAGTNLTANGNSTTHSPTVNLGAGGVLYIGASARYMFMDGYNSAAFDNRNTFIGERERIEPWDTTQNGYPLLVFGSTSITAVYTPRMKGPTTDSISTTSATYSVDTPIGATMSSELFRDASFNPKHGMAPMVLRQVGSGTVVPQRGGTLTDGIFKTTTGYGAAGDEMVYAGNNYLIFSNGSVRFAVPKF